MCIQRSCIAKTELHRFVGQAERVPLAFGHSAMGSNSIRSFMNRPKWSREVFTRIQTYENFVHFEHESAHPCVSK